MSIKLFDEKERVSKRQKHKRTSEKITKEDFFKQIFETFVEAKVKQNLRPKSLNQFIVVFNNVEQFQLTRSRKPLYLTEVDTEFLPSFGSELSFWYYALLESKFLTRED